MQETLLDVLVIGAGTPGLVVASKLATAGLRVNVLDRAAAPTAAARSASRVSALSLASKSILAQSGLVLDPAQLSAIETMFVWDSLSKACITFSAQANGQDVLAYLVDNAQLNQNLLQHLKNFSQLEVHHSITPARLTIAADAVRLTTTTGQRFAAKLIIGADGGRSWLREQLSMQFTQRDYHQSAIVATIGVERPHKNTAYQCFLPSGPLAFLPLLDPQQCSIVWSTTAAASLLNADEGAFIAALEHNIENKLGKLTLLSPRSVFPLQMRHAKEYVRERVALIGDAAHTFHPLAGQGLNLGLADAACLAEVIIAAYKKQRQFFSLPTLKKYQRERSIDNSNMILAIEGFHQLFTRINPLLVKVRGLGLRWVERTNWLKRGFMNLV